MHSVPPAVPLLLVLVASACGATTRPDGGQGILPVGSPAPDVEGRDASGARVSLASASGRHRVVYFYPKDATPGCTREACAFRDAWDRYQARGVQVFGVSRDSEASHDRFREEHRLPFPLVADEDGRAQRAYGVASRLGMSARVTFVVGPDGRVERVIEDVDPGVHADEILASIR
ncbi:MAG: peroxiredoxin [Deltaproteobacteria bacterium]|nr:peroxiredoxin [Deltaproteobacteria bacterium]